MAFPLLLLLAGAAAIQTAAQLNAAEADAIELEVQADQEKTAAEGRELQRREQLNKVLSRNVVDLAASGMSGEGTPQSIALSNAKKASTSEAMLSLSDKLKQQQLMRRASNVRSTGKMQAASTLLSGAANMQKVG